MNPTTDLPSGAPGPHPYDDEWEEEQSGDTAQDAIERRFHEMMSHPDRVTIDLTETQYDKVSEAECENEANLEPGVAQVIEVIDLTNKKPPRRPRQTAPLQQRNPPIALPNRWIECYTYNGMELKRGTTVEIHADPRLCDASFLLIQFIIRTESGIILRGLPLTRTRNLRGQLQRLRNEVALVLHIDQDDIRPEEEQAAIEIPVDKIQKIRTCHITNKNFPEHRFPVGIYKDKEEIEEKGILICRWKCCFIWGDARKRVSGSPSTEFVVAHLTAKEVPRARFRASDACIMNVWRGGKVRGGAHIPEEPETRLTVDVEDESQDVWVSRKPGQQYTFADMFCGAGGASCGAKDAGFYITLSCDNADGACNTYRLHFPEADLRHQDMYDFIMDMRVSRHHIDFLHLSPPCQFWSPAHTTAGVNDEANIAILFSCHELIKILRPRVFTLEQTFGILHPRFEYYFNALVYGFTQYNYSVRWKVVNLLSWGAPSQRQRLVMIGACPGEELPPYPVATHSRDPIPGDGTKPYRTVWTMLKRIRTDGADDLHEPHNMARVQKLPWDPRKPLPRTITCGGGQGNYHYNGKRGFTLREFATLQGFPANYRFQKPEQKRQIGNAFPPLVVKTLYKNLRRWLEQKDHVFADEDELSESEEEDYSSEPETNSEVEFMGSRKAEKEVEYLGKRKLRHSSSIMSIRDSNSDTEMDNDARSEDVHSLGVCVDAVQQRGARPNVPIELE
ncbi:S-adenosyl-L-methionine-dependent methyltransferase [Hypoxylon rubiginosum]|uniref:S-adenosyl-L-methionine-dependent methyltransferase n=1 Tax=Hypoxylon rubiginosum TaxID=110542 RepID=A0ACC0CQF3_9PEZI|nr:S-adenosyl-L-methionine-dependent methyltransferase [Hypoxylon rubiginosum]